MKSGGKYEIWKSARATNMGISISISKMLSSSEMRNSFNLVYAGIASKITPWEIQLHIMSDKRRANPSTPNSILANW